MTETIDELGPVDWIVVEFPGSRFNGEIAPALRDLVQRELIRVLDLLILKKDQDGSLEAFELSDLDPSEAGELRSYEQELAMLLSEDDVTAVAAAIEPGSSAAVLVWENTLGRSVRLGRTPRWWAVGRERQDPHPGHARRHRGGRGIRRSRVRCLWPDVACAAQR